MATTVDFQRHFSHIADRYRSLRMTDAEPIGLITKYLNLLPKVSAADVGCGTGRYSLKLFKQINSRLNLYCIDSNREMLAKLDEHLSLHDIDNYQAVISVGAKLPIQDNSLECVLTFNAVHHFATHDFL